MNTAVTVDASVVVNAFSPTEKGSEQSWRFLAELREKALPLIVPTLLLVEVVATLARKQNNTELALDWLYEFTRYPHVTWINLDENLAALAAEIAARHRLRSSDAVYVAVARRFATPLVTLDAEQLERAQAVVTVRKP
jgi:predicted nucleic acid-binding protein